MDLLKECILERGFVRSEKILDVSNFLNAQVDAELMQALGKDFAEKFKDHDFDMFVTVEASGIAPAVFASLYANKPLVVIKKQSIVMDPEIYVQQPSYSYTKDVNYFLSTKSRLIEGKKCILIDDFLAEGSVVKNVEIMLKKVNASLVATGICISKNFQPGYKFLKDNGYDLYSQVQLKELLPEIKFIEE